MDAIRTKIALTALFSRLVVWILSVVSNALIPDHDAGDAFRWTPTPRVNETSFLDSVISFLFDGLTRWDGQHFLHIANNGYTYESSLAFFPVYPAVVRLVGELVYWLQVDYGLLHFSSALRIAAVLLNVACFTGAALALFELSRRVLREDYLAYKSALIFCWNPASVFFSAAYSESLYSLMTFCALLRLERAGGFAVKTALLLAAASAVRANALVNAGFALYKGLRGAARELAIHRRLKQLDKAELSETVTNVVGDSLVPSVLTALATCAPFVAFQWFAFTRFCKVTKPRDDFTDEIVAYGRDHGLKMPSDDPSEWCQTSRDFSLPLPYAYVQSHYWGVGFLGYYEFKQLPNFMLAAPVLYIVVGSCLKFFRYHRYYCARLGCTYFHVDPAQQRAPVFDIFSADRVLPKECFPYMLHALALAVFMTLFAHVQVSTRLLLSASPVFFWLVALHTAPPKHPMPPAPDLNRREVALRLESARNLDETFLRSWKSVLTDEWSSRSMLNQETRWIRTYFVVYVVAGTVLFSNYLPWT